MSDNAACSTALGLVFAFIVAMYAIFAFSGMKGPNIVERARHALDMFRKARSTRTRWAAAMLIAPIVFYSARAALFTLFSVAVLTVASGPCKVNWFQDLANAVRSIIDLWRSIWGSGSPLKAA
ncbi:MAG: hypothetical protein ABL907_06670 [Hyphomicrobium sp.]